MGDESAQTTQPTLAVCRTVRFSAAHHLYNPAWPPEENERVFGRCSREGGHGHNYSLTLSVTGAHDRTTGMVVNVSQLQKVLEREVVDQLDRRNLNTDVPFLAGVIPTMENLVEKLAGRLGPCLKPLGVSLRRIELAESETNRVIMECT